MTEGADGLDVIVSGLAARLRRLEDLLDIQQLFVDYGRYLDAGDFRSYAALFTGDGEILLGPMGRASGPQEIEALMTKALADTVGDTYHLITSPVIELDGDRATAEVMWTVVAREDHDQPRVTMIGRHVDELVRERQRWRFRRRQGHISIPSRYGPS